MAEQKPQRGSVPKQNVEKPRAGEAPPFTTPRTDPLSTWGTSGSEDDKSGDRSNPRPVQPAPGEPDPDTAEKGAWRDGDATRRIAKDDDLKAGGT
jgi:hypothetical protein